LDVKPFKRKKTKKWKIEKYCKNPLVCPLKVTCSDGWQREMGIYSAETKTPSICSFLFTVLQTEIRCNFIPGNPRFYFKNYTPVSRKISSCGAE
jgi:hypothetical protein